MGDLTRPPRGPLAGDLPGVARGISAEPVTVDTFAGPVHVEWDPDAAVTPLGHLAFFAEYLKVSGRFDALVADCPLFYTSPNAPAKRDVIGTALLSILAGQWRYAHITALRGDTVNPALLGMGKVVSEDAVRRGLAKIEEAAGTAWLQGHLDDTLRPLLSEPWILDCDTTIKPLYGHQQGAVVGYNPHKPGRPSHAYHSFLMAGVRLVLDVAVAPGNRHTSKTSEPHLWDLLGRLGREHWPRLVRGDRDWGNERNMASCEREGVDYLFKLRLTKGGQRTVEKAIGDAGWEETGQGWWDRQAHLRLSGWNRLRRVVVASRRLPETVALTRKADDRQGELLWADGRDRRRGVGVRGAGDVAGSGSPVPGPTVARPRRRREPFRRTEEPVGLGRLHRPRFEALPDHRPPHLSKVRLTRKACGPCLWRCRPPRGHAGY